MGVVALFDLLILISLIALNDIEWMPLARQRLKTYAVVAGVRLAVVVQTFYYTAWDASGKRVTCVGCAS